VQRRSRGVREGGAREAAHRSCGAGREGIHRNHPSSSAAPLFRTARAAGEGEGARGPRRASLPRRRPGRRDRALDLRRRSPRSGVVVAVPDAGDGGQLMQLQAEERATETGAGACGRRPPLLLAVARESRAAADGHWGEQRSLRIMAR
jgi:hypothetical protein